MTSNIVFSEKKQKDMGERDCVSYRSGSQEVRKI